MDQLRDILFKDTGMTEFERRQLIAIRNELNRAHAERTAPVVNANLTASPTRLSSKTRT
jgi:hypothetical protein